MKKKFGLLSFLGSLFLFGSSVYALSFGPNTIFLDAKDEQNCDQMNGSFMERYGSTYCTITAEILLSDQEKELINKAGEKILSLIGNRSEKYELVQTLLYGYLDTFRQEKNNKKVATVMMLQFFLEMNK